MNYSRQYRVVRASSERGQALLLSITLMVLCLFGALIVGHLARLASERSHAQSVADATALAGAVGDRAAAEDVARENGASLDLFDVSDGEVTVEISIDGFGAGATAEVGIDQSEGPSE